MRVKIKSFLTLFLVLLVQNLIAQERNVSGKVTDSNGLPLPGVSVVEKGTTNGTQTDFDGNYKVKVGPSAILVYTFIGMKTQEVKASTTVLNVKLEDEAKVLEGVVVTALGISRDKKSLGYSSQKLDERTVNSTPTNNFLNNLSGKVSGLEVKTNSNFGGSTNIVLRGSKSLTGNNQALMVVDGVPISNSNLNSDYTQSGRRGFDYGNSASDIDPNNIESITVLKGAAATALYGSQAANGAIMITTKKGKKNNAMGVSISSTTSIGSYDKKTFAKYQKGYGAGGYSGADDSFYSEDVNGDGINDLLLDMTADASYGNAFDPGLMVYQWSAFDQRNPNFGKPTPWVAGANDPSTFFRNSFSTVNSININGGDEKSTYNFSYTNNNETGILPNSILNRNIINGNFGRDLNDKIKATAFFTYVNQNTTGRNSIGYNDNIITGFRQWWPTNVDIAELRESYFRNSTNATWNMNDPLNGNFSPAYWNNPYWDRYENYSTDKRTRFLTGATISADIVKNVNLLGRVTVDNSSDRQEIRKAIGSHAEEFGIQNLDETSGYNLYTRSFTQQTYDFIATYNFNMSDNFSGKLLAGSTFIKSNADSFESSTIGGLVAPNLYTLANSKSFVAPIESEIDYQKLGLYAQASFDYKRTVFIEGSFRRDQSTALPTNNNKYNYYSVGASLIASEFINAPWLSNLKLRGNYAVVGNDPAPGLIGSKVNNGIIGGNLMFSNGTVYSDFNSLKAEKLKSWEFGLEAAMFKNRLNFDVSVYQSNTTDQIYNVPQSTSTSYATSRINAGEMQNKGIEASVFGSPIKTEDFEWQITVNWSKNKNEVVSLNQGRDNLQLATFQSGVSLNATVGEPYGTLRGTDFVYDANGNKVVGSDGHYLTASNKVIGDIQADWIGGVSNRITYKNVSLNFLIDVKQGGDLYSLDMAYGLYSGIYPETAGLNDLGNPVRNPVANGGGVILEGVYADGTPNTTRIEANYVGSAFGTQAAPAKAFVYDASYVKLREVGLSYNFNTKLLERTFFKSLSLSLLGNNLWIIDKNVPYADPEAGTSSGNIQGYQSGVMPTTRVYSLNIKASF